MSINTYVINLEKDNRRFQNIIVELNNVGIHNVFKYNAINGKTIDISKYKKYLDPITNIYTIGAIGCGLSHILLAEYLYYNDPNDIVMICEDDIVTNDKFNTKLEIENCIRTAPENWDIILLSYYTSQFSDTNHKKINLFDWGTQCYLISKSGMKKMMNTKLKCHIDMQRNLTNNIITYKYKHNLFYPDSNLKVIWLKIIT